jgi:hypothetical protein
MRKKDLDLLQSMVQEGIIETPPKGWFTAKEYAKETRRTPQHSSKMLLRAVEKFPEKISSKTFHIRSGKRIYPVLHYYVNPKKTK